MNREQRRSMNKSKGGELKYLKTPCTISEAAQIARGVAEEVVADYHQHTGHLQISMSLQLEILKEVVIKAGLITEEEFKELYVASASEFNEAQRRATEEESSDEAGDVKMADMNVGDVEVQKEVKEIVDEADK